MRLNLPYFMSDDAVDFVLEAVKMVAEHGWKLLPQYMFNPETGEWKHRTHQVIQSFLQAAWHHALLSVYLSRDWPSVFFVIRFSGIVNGWDQSHTHKVT